MDVIGVYLAFDWLESHRHEGIQLILEYSKRGENNGLP